MHDADQQQEQAAEQGRAVDEFEPGAADQAECGCVGDVRDGRGAPESQRVERGGAGVGINVGQLLRIGDQHRCVARHGRIEDVAAQAPVEFLGEQDRDADGDDDDPQRRGWRNGDGDEQARDGRAAVRERPDRLAAQALAEAVASGAGDQSDHAMGEDQRPERPSRGQDRGDERDQHAVHHRRRRSRSR